jgi:hypothetical protein
MRDEVPFANPILEEVAEGWQKEAIAILDLFADRHRPIVAIYMMIAGAQAGIFRILSADFLPDGEFQQRVGTECWEVIQPWLDRGDHPGVILARLLTGASSILTTALEEERKAGRL